ncbi:serine protease HtrA [Lapidilactobacillus dextrinicus DSM 20335]|uniref:Serine protease HtrA n=1 Tax=Lapidilactobacillus dextrinicus DSM 20335 TaxID=1423738 RepID=A0A0R2BM10_9LACO|nr:trypsin-like peptidase domain-containing protein [Lapidilactobacillus dextrinicus]KRM78884.1 serine protease HtrA [Lapidilactobacillus dextrinicus DSM 20335]QFG47517.1 PDZ domain-containing protein [Lapidilactobacillus dextrinicus]
MDEQHNVNPNNIDPNQNNGNKHRDKKGASLWQIAIVAVVSALIGGGIAFAGFEMVGKNQANSSDNATTSSTAGTAKVSNVSVKTSSAMTKAFNKVEGAVVSVINQQKESQNSEDPFASLFGNSAESNNSSSDSSELETVSEGSGVIYKKADGKAYIVTNNHVVSGSDQIEVILADGTKLTAKIVGTDATTDLAVLSISSDKVTAVATFGNSSTITTGEPVIAIGSPLGSDYATSVTQGIVSAKSRTIDVTDEDSNQVTGQATVIQTDAAINPGNSGGPLVNSSGQVIGINSSKLASSSDGTSVEGMGFAIPSNEVVSITNQLVANGKVSRPALGVSIVDLANVTADAQKETLKLPSSVTSGVVVASVNAGSPAKNAGLKKYDTIVEVDGKKVDSIAAIHTIIYAHKLGDQVKVKYYRDGTAHTTTVTLDQEAKSSSSSTSSQN